MSSIVCLPERDLHSMLQGLYYARARGWSNVAPRFINAQNRSLYCFLTPNMQVLQKPCAALFFRSKTARHVSRCRKIAQPTASLQEIIRTRGLVIPTSVAQDVATLTGATAVAAALYAVVARKKPSGKLGKLMHDVCALFAMVRSPYGGVHAHA